MIRTYLWFIGSLLAIWFGAGCGTADDFAVDLAATRAGAGDSAVQVEADTAAEASTGSTDADGSRRSNRPVLEVTSQASLGQTEQETNPAATINVDTDRPNGDGAAAGQSDPTDSSAAVAPNTTGQPAAIEVTTTTTTVAPTPDQTDPTADSQAAPPTTMPPATDPPTTPDTTVASTTTAAPLPASAAEPNCSVSCNIAMEGDSLTVGLGNRLCQAVQTGNCINSGIVGRRVEEMIVTARTDVDNQLGSGTNDVLILWGGTNDLWQKFHSPDPATNAAAVYEQITLFVSERRAAGWDRIYVMTLPPMNPTYVVGTEPLNDLIRQNGAEANGIIDVGADARLANAFDPAMRAADGIHFGDGGRAVVMEHILATIGQLDGV